MTQDEIIEIAKKLKMPHYYQDDAIVDLKKLEVFAELVAQHEREIWERRCERLQSLMNIRETQPNKPCCLAEREACAKIGDDHPSWSSRMYSATIRARGQA